MKPSFALQFTESGITLLHRTGRGWLPLGDAALDDRGLADNLGYLRATALGLEPQGITTKLVIPNGQILYTKVDAPAPEPGKRRNQIRRALEGRTPYNVEDLAFDWSGSGPEVMVAVVPRETLAEAEAFALEHRFNPMGFVAMAEPGTFDGEPFFGPSAHAGASLAAGEKVERDRAAMRIIGRGDGARAAGAKVAVPVVPDMAEPVLAETGGSAQSELPLSDVVTVEVAPVSEAEPVVESAEPDAVKPEPAPLEPVAESLSSGEFEPADLTPVAAAATLTAMDPLVASLIAGAEADLETVAAPPAPASDPASDTDSDLVQPLVEPVAQPAIRPNPSPLQFAPMDDVPEAPAMFDVPMDDGDLPPMPHSVAAFASRRNGAVTATAVAGGDARQPVLGPALKPVSVIAAAVAGPAVEGPAVPPSSVTAPPRAVAKPGNGKVADPRAKLTAAARNGAQPGSMARYVPMKGKGSAARAQAEAVAPGDRPDTAEFGKSPLARRPQVRGKPKYLGLTLTLLLVLALAAVAIWSNYYLGIGTVDPAAEITSPAATDSVNAAGGAIPADSALPLADLAQSDVLVEPPEADPANADVTATDAVAVESITTDPATAAETAAETAAAAAAAVPDPSAAASESSTPPEAAAVPDATLSTSDQPVQADTGSVATAGAVVPPIPDPVLEAIPDPVPDAVAAEVVPIPDPAASAAVTPATRPDPAAGATTGTGTQTAEVSAPLPEPKPEPPAVAPQAETSATAALRGQVLDPGDALPELLASDKGLQTPGPAQLAEPLALAGDSRPETPLPPAPFGTFFDRDARGWVIATPEGAVTPEGALVIAGRPDVTPPRRPLPPGATPDGTARADPPAPDTGAAAVQSDPALAGARPRPRPQAPGGNQDGTALQIEPQIATASTARPRARPDAPFAQALPDTGQGFATATNRAITISGRPASRPADIAASVAAALASVEPQAPATEPEQVVAAVAPLPRPVVPKPEVQPQAAAPEADNEPEVATAMPAIPQNASVAKQATLANAINLGKINLIGVYGTPSNRHALVRLPSGRYVRVKVGDRVDGGQVAAISEQELRYIKNGRNLVLALPKDS